MKRLSHWLTTVLAISGLVTSTVEGANCCDLNDFNDELDERDFQAVTEYINTKRTIELEEKACNLVISGDIRAEWSFYTESQNGKALRGRGKRNCLGLLMSRNDFDIDLNLYFDYKCERAWGVAHLEFDNTAGVESSRKGCGEVTGEYRPCNPIDPWTSFGSGECGSLCLRKAYMGYNICADGDSRLDFEIGRRRLYDVFDSRIQFLARFDGMILRYATQWEDTDLYWNLGGFLVDERANHFAWVTELGAINLMDWGLDLKYSYIDWEKEGQNRCEKRHADGWLFKNMQWTAAYHFYPDFFCSEGKFYGAFLWNAAARRFPYFDNELANIGWYAGILIGEVAEEGDWSIDANYQYVQAQAIPEADVSGIGKGNLLNQTMTMAKPYSNPFYARGNANYKGFRIEGLYALTDNLSIDAQFQHSVPVNKNIGGSFKYSKFKIEAIYAF